MAEFQVIDGIKKKKTNYHKLYENAFIKTLKNAVEEIEKIREYDSFKDIDLDTRKRMVWYGVKMIGADKFKNPDYGHLLLRFQMISSINELMGTLTPRDLQTVFPIEKDYKGEKFKTKDYFYSKRYIKEFGEDKVIGEEINKFLWEYQNRDICFFVVETMSTMSAIRRAGGEKGIAQEFFEEQGHTTYTVSKENNGKLYLTNNDTGQVEEVKKPAPKHLKVVK